MKRRVAVFGGYGQLGADLIPALLPEHAVLAVDKNIAAALGFDCESMSVDITRPAEIATMINRWEPDVIVNLAAMTDVDGCERNQELAWQINAGGVNNIITAVGDRACSLIQVSTDYIFDGQTGPYSEKAAISPINYYGRSKLEGENFITASGLDWSIIRTNVVFGASIHTGASFLKWVVDSLQAGKNINIVDDQWNNPTWTVGLAETIRNFIDNNVTGIYNYGGADYLNRLDFARLIAEIYQLDQSLISPIKSADLNQMAPRPLLGGVKNDLIETLPGIKCYTVRTAIESIRALGTI